jgi:hypothetical protein
MASPALTHAAALVQRLHIKRAAAHLKAANGGLQPGQYTAQGLGTGYHSQGMLPGAADNALLDSYATYHPQAPQVSLPPQALQAQGAGTGYHSQGMVPGMTVPHAVRGMAKAPGQAGVLSAQMLRQLGGMFGPR